MRQVILDTETTGLNPEAGHRIIEIGCIELINRKITNKNYHQYINPNCEIEAGALAVHGITQEFLQGKPAFAEIVRELMDFIQGAELIIHNAPFDVGFLNHELALTKQNWKKIENYCRVTDTLVMARQLHVGQRNSLDALCKRYGIDNSQRELHGALMDAHLLAQVYLAMTGGQGSLFDDAQHSESTQTNFTPAQVQQARQQYKLPILQATADERVLHEKKLQQMAAKGKCIWIEESAQEQ